jgi:hypothetical protein
MRLTTATLAAFSKYPRCSDRALKLPGRVSTKKHGFCRADEEIFAAIAKETGLVPRISASGGRAWCRHPLAFLVEAADDGGPPSLITVLARLLTATGTGTDAADGHDHAQQRGRTLLAFRHLRPSLATSKAGGSAYGRRLVQRRPTWLSSIPEQACDRCSCLDRQVRVLLDRLDEERVRHLRERATLRLEH